MATTYFANLHNETLALLIESKHYIQSLQSLNQSVSGAIHRTKNTDCLDLSVATMRLTSGLTDIMAWTMAQRAVTAGAISAQECASRFFRLSLQSVCFEHDLSIYHDLPEQLRELHQKSHDLYRRVARLDGQICGRLGEGQSNQNRDIDEYRLNIVQFIPATTSGQDPRNVY